MSTSAFQCRINGVCNAKARRWWEIEATAPFKSRAKVPVPARLYPHVLTRPTMKLSYSFLCYKLDFTGILPPHLHRLSHAHHRLLARRSGPHPGFSGPHPPQRPLVQPHVSTCNADAPSVSLNCLAVRRGWHFCGRWAICLDASVALTMALPTSLPRLIIFLHPVRPTPAP